MAQNIGADHWQAQRAKFTSDHQFKYQEDGISSWTQNEALNHYTDEQIGTLYNSLIAGKTLTRSLPLSFIAHVLKQGWNASGFE